MAVTQQTWTCIAYILFYFFGASDCGLNTTHHLKLQIKNTLFGKTNNSATFQLEKSGLPVKGKRPSRKFRRRPSNLLQEYNRRQRKNAWLETHIWHAKRFHMLERWGYKLPNYPNDKAYRACYRATAKHCLIQVSTEKKRLVFPCLCSAYIFYRLGYA